MAEPPKLITVELQDALAWWCESCGKENFTRWICCYPLRQRGQVYQCPAIPERVRCCECKTEFATRHEDME